MLAGTNYVAFGQTDTTTRKTNTSMKNTKQEQAFIDKFFVPAAAKDEFLQRMKYNRDFISKLEGFINDNVYFQTDENGNLVIITVAIWHSAQDIANAKEAVFAEYKRIGFNPAEFYERLHIQMDRGVYSPFED